MTTHAPDPKIASMPMQIHTKHAKDPKHTHTKPHAGQDAVVYLCAGRPPVGGWGTHLQCRIRPALHQAWRPARRTPRRQHRGPQGRHWCRSPARCPQGGLRSPGRRASCPGSPRSGSRSHRTSWREGRCQAAEPLPAGSPGPGRGPRQHQGGPRWHRWQRLLLPPLGGGRVRLIRVLRSSQQKNKY